MNPKENNNVSVKTFGFITYENNVTVEVNKYTFWNKNISLTSLSGM